MKEKFLEKLTLYLSFYFDNTEVTNIINDYEEWFKNESLQGKSEQEICLTLQSPRKVFHNLISENYDKTTRITQLFCNVITQTVVCIIVLYSMSCLLLRFCNHNSFNYFPFALCVIFLCYIGENIIIKKADFKLNIDSRIFYIANLLASGLTIMIILLEIFLLPKINYVNCGKIYTFVLSVLSLFIFLVSLFIMIKKMFQNREFVLFTILHLFGIVSLLFFGINQAHMLYDISEYSTLIYGSIGIYIATVILCLVFYIQKIYIKK